MHNRAWCRKEALTTMYTTTDTLRRLLDAYAPLALAALPPPVTADDLVVLATALLDANNDPALRVARDEVGQLLAAHPPGMGALLTQRKYKVWLRAYEARQQRVGMLLAYDVPMFQPLNPDPIARPGTFDVSGKGLYAHDIDDATCTSGWCHGGESYPFRCICGGLIHADFGDEHDDGYWLHTTCDRCGRPE